ncbi:hypothetical protein F4778DRAFT_297876 [Xylariomycetidae sp. FL2044]|nr:hypothetical protein F4778DRAFT_297876 [Xylariomycetidae sp. FL2044]
MSNPWGIPEEEWYILPHDSRAPLMIGAAVLCIFVATLAVGLRLYTRGCILRSLWHDDFLAAAALLGTITAGAILCAHTRYGLAGHYWDMTPTSSVEFWKIFYATTLTYNVTLLLIKLSLFFQYYRLIQDIKEYSLLYVGIMFLVVAWSTAQIFVLMFQCTPIAKVWDYTMSGHCLESKLITWINAIGNIVTDVIVLMLPMPVVWRLNLKRGQKWGVIGIFSLGFTTCIISICRLIFYGNIGYDFSYDTAPVAIWTLAELASGLTCAALITLRPLFRKLVRKWFPNFRSRSKSSGIWRIRFYPFSRSNASPFPRVSGSKSGLHRTKVTGEQFDGSETELTSQGGVRKGAKASAANSKYTSSASRSKQRSRRDSEEMPDHRLGLESGIRTVISCGDGDEEDDRMRSRSPPAAIARIGPTGILVEQEWSVQNKEYKEFKGSRVDSSDSEASPATSPA